VQVLFSAKSLAQKAGTRLHFFTDDSYLCHLEALPNPASTRR
jgi:hypothetical protein